MRRRILIDTDPGIDDALAILLALAAPELEVLGLSSVAGNVTLEHTTNNALRLRALAGHPTLPVHAGCGRPLRRDPVFATSHGHDGLGGLELPASGDPAASRNAVAWLAALLADAAPRSITLVAIGPLTNIAVLLAQAPRCRDAIAELVIMGGATPAAGGNMNPYAEFNFFADPEAAAQVFAAGLPTTLVPLDLAYGMRVTPERLQALLPSRSAGGAVLAALLTHYAKGDGHLYDPLTIAWLLWPEFFEGRRAFVRIETDGERAGESRFDWNERGDCRVLLQGSEIALFARLAERFQNL